MLALGLALSFFRAFDLYELQTYDWRCQIRGPRPVSDKIVFIDIWDDTLKELGAWPFDRAYHAELIKILSAHGVKAVGLDFLFVEPRDGDEAVAQAAQAAGNTYFAYAFDNVISKKGMLFSDKILAPLIDPYIRSAKAVAFVNAKADLDGKRRRTPAAIVYQDKTDYQLSFRIAMDLLGIKEGEVSVRPGKYIAFSKDFRIPLDDEGFFLVNYAGRWEKTYQHYSYYDVLAAHLESMQGEKPRIDLEKLRGKVCFVGLTSLGSHDTSPVPIQSIYPMVGMYGNVLNSILEQDFIRRLDRLTNLLLLLAGAFWIILASVKMRPVKSFLVALLALVLYTGGAILVFYRWGLWIDLFYPLTLFIVIYAASMLWRTIFEMQKRELIENELRIASQIQKSFLPASLPEQKGLELAVFMKPAKAVGGDLYNFVRLSEDKLGIMVGDVSGKGTPAALFMAKAVSEFKFSAREKTDPASVLAELNHSIASESTGGLFVTLSYAIFDIKNRKALISNGGHLPSILVGKDGRAELVTCEEGMPIGVIDEVSFSSMERPIKEGDCFAFYSDGVSEARNKKKEEYGVETLQRLIVENRDLPAQKILDNAMSHLNHFMGKADQHDDITLIIAKVGALNGE